MTRMPKHLRPQLTPAQLAWFRAHGKKIGAQGGQTAAARMTAEERTIRARKGGLAAARAKKARAQGRAGDQRAKADKS
jgi:hypothetical protein